MKNRKGSTLILTLIVFVFLSILAMGTISFMVSENNQSIYHKNKIEAYYIARSGAEATEAAILQMNEDELELLNEKLESGKIKVEEVLIDDSSADVSLDLDNVDKNLIITSVGKININDGNSDKYMVTKVMERKTGNERNFEIKNALFSNNDIVIGNSATIKGDVATNKSIVLKNSAKITGKVDLKNGESINKHNNAYIGSLSNDRTKSIKYNQFIFPDIYHNDSNKKRIIKNNGKETIELSDDYKEIEVKNSGVLTIDATLRDISLNIKNFTIGNSATIEIKGNNKVIIYVEDIKWNNSSSIEYTNSNVVVDIYHYGDKKIDVGNSVKVKFNLYIKNAELNLKNASKFEGNIFSNGTNVSLDNSGDIYGLIYAPEASFNIKNSGKVLGAVICDESILGNSSYIEYNKEFIEDAVSIITPTINYKNSYYK